jgi:Outer membrane protein beta-barrel family
VLSNIAIKKQCLLAVSLLLFFQIANAQQSADTVNTGIAKGSVKDSLYNFMLISSTVAVYKVKDSGIVQFTLTNEFGEFTLTRLPLSVPLRLIITYTGYKPFIKEFSLSSSQRKMDMDTIYVHSIAESQATNEEVIVTSIAPMRMKGDTLEFNADAFRLDSNANAEDLMRRLPGFTIWGDGEITFNGKKLQAIYVNGKPFFGSNITVATQNLPKEIINKIQVYQQTNESNPYDSTLYANIKLKGGKNLGYFGKISAGAGTNGRYSADVMLNKYNKKMQFSIVGAGNNVNKIANNIEELIRSSSFKGEGANIEYQPDFNITGLNKPVAAGLHWQYDFLPDVIYFRKHRITSDYFFKHNNIFETSTGFVKTAFDKDSLQIQNSNTYTQTIQTNQSLNFTYEKTMADYSLMVDASGSLDKNKREGEDSLIVENTGQGIIGKSHTIAQSENTDKSIKATIRYQRSKEGDSKKGIPRNFTIEYILKSQNNLGEVQRNVTNESFVNMPATLRFNRHYNKSGTDMNNTIRVVYPGLKQLLFGNRIDLGGIAMNLSNTVTFNAIDNTDNVLDWDSVSHSFKYNNNLTNKRNERTVNYLPAVGFSKTRTRGLTHRYNKYIDINLNLKAQYYNNRSEAIQTNQNFKYNYWFFVPDAAIEYNNHQYGSHETKYTLSYQTVIGYPTVSHIAPLTDSSNYWYLPMGNKNILPEINREFLLQYSFVTRKPKNPLNINLMIRLSQKKNAFSDSIIYDTEGRKFVYPINMQGSRTLKSDFLVKKSLEKKKHTFQIQVQDKFSIYRIPQFINTSFNISGTIVNELSVHLDYSFRDRLAMKVQQGQTTYVSSQSGLNNRSFKSDNIFTRLTGVLQFPTGLLWSSSLTYTKNNFGNQTPVKITIWNASLTYRFLKGKNGEIKFSALDILQQNRNIVNNTEGNMQVFNSSNVLQQYFMLTLSYYPRKFGN